MPLEQCRDGAAGRPSAEGSKLLPGTTIFLGPFLPLSVAPHGQTQFTSSVFGGLTRFLLRCSLRDFLGFCHGLWLFWSWFLLLQMGERHSSPGIHFGHHLFVMGFPLLSVGMQLGLHPGLVGIHLDQEFQYLFHCALLHSCLIHSIFSIQSS
jgi:hypothetical protein